MTISTWFSRKNIINTSSKPVLRTNPWWKICSKSWLIWTIFNYKHKIGRGPRTPPGWPNIKDPPNTGRHFVDDGIGDFRDKSHADGFLNYLNSLTDNLQYTIEYPSHDGSLLYMDILVHVDKFTSVYRKPTHYNSCAPSSSKYSVIRSLKRRARIHT